jgi:isopentenyl-diphosphate delta-isomerase
MNRKDDHIRLALDQTPNLNDFDRVRFVHNALATLAVEDIDISVAFFNQRFDLPIYINAMTGGSDQAGVINGRLAQLAQVFKLPMATGSLSAALKNPAFAKTYTVILDTYPEGFRIANVGADVPLDRARKAVELIQAQALQIHLNVAQELIMPEGDRDFRAWPDHIRSILDKLEVPVIIKEVGFGMSREAIQGLKELGGKTLDVSGHGGTNFAQIENARRTQSLSYLNSWGLSTVESLYEAQAFPELNFLASGGVRHALDVIKALALGARMVGLSSYFLRLVSEHSHEEAVKKVQALVDELKALMVLVGAASIEELRTKPLIVDAELANFLQQRTR